jgi:hypothetical protein
MLIPKGSAANSFVDERQAQISGKRWSFSIQECAAGRVRSSSQYAQIETRDPTGEFTKARLLVARLEVTCHAS